MISILPLGSRRNKWPFAAVTLLSAGCLSDVHQLKLTERMSMALSSILFCCAASSGTRLSREGGSKCAGTTTLRVVA
jgi:hypothetical protein